MTRKTVEEALKAEARTGAAVRIKVAVKIALCCLLGRHLYEKVMMRWHLGYWPHIRHPSSFNEKTAHRKLFAWRNIPPQLADKWAVRQWVAQTAGAQYLNEVYGLYEKADDIDFSKLPEDFVLKGTHGSAMNVIVRSRDGFDENAAREKCRKFLATKYGWLCNEFWYGAIPPRIMAEKYIVQTGKTLPDDYRFFVFGGRMAFVEVDCNKRTPAASNSNMDRNWNVQPFIQYLPIDPSLPKPGCWEEMVAVAEKLGQGWDFVRVDLYCPDGKTIIFGEMTFAHESGWSAFLPSRDYDFEVGKLWLPA